MRAIGILQQLIAPPTFADEQQSRVAGLLHRITLGLALLALLYSVMTLLYHPSQMPFYFGSAVFGLCILLNWLNRAGHIRVVSIILVVSLWAVFTVGGMVGQSAGVFDASFTGYILPIILASFLLGARAGMLLTGISIVAGVVILLGQISDPNAPFSTPRLILQWSTASVLFVAAASLLALSRRSLLAAIAQAQVGEKVLAEKNTALQQAIDERQKAEDLSRTRYERLLRAFHAAGLETWVWNKAKDLTEYPDTAPEVAALFPHNLADFYDRIHPDDREATRQIIDRAIQAGEEYEVVYRYYNQGQLEWYYAQASPDFDAQGKVVSYTGSVFDITRRRIAEEGLHASEASARAFLEKLKALHEVSIQLAQTTTLDDLYRQAVELARSKLGFDRFALFLLSDDNPNEVVGTYGTDTQGQMRDEHTLRFSLDDNELVLESLKSRLHVAIRRENNLWDRHEIIGKGWNAMAMLWSETGAIGWLAADNLIHQEPPNDDQLELLSLFGSMLGPLILKKQAEMETQRHQQRLRLALQAGGMFSWTWDLRTNDITIDEVLPSGVPAVTPADSAFVQIHPDDQHLIQEALERTRTQNVPYAVEYRTILNDGVPRWVYALGQAYRDDTGKIAGIVGVSQDITERKQAEERFYKAFNANPSAIAITRVDDGRYIEINDEWARLTGYTRAETIGHTSIELGFWEHPDDRQKMNDRFDEKGYLRDVELIAGGKDGRKVPVMMLAETIELNGETCYLTMLQDISGRKEAEKQALELALQRERNALLTEFMSNVSHDIKTPLTAINTSLYLLERIGDVSQQRERLATIRSHTQLLERYIQDILTISRLDYAPGLDLKPVALDGLLRETIARLRPAVENKNLALTLDLAPTAPPLLADADELSRVMVNLVENAVNYTPAGGTVQVRTAVNQDTMVIEISDTGIGIGEADIARIFSRFYRAEPARRTHEGGTGLGLAIVKKIIEMHNGSIDVTSAIGKGTTFRIRLPLAKTA